jgi:hypothetical protein
MDTIWLTPRAAAAILWVTTQTVKRYAEAGNIGVRWQGRARRYSEVDVLALLIDRSTLFPDRSGKDDDGAGD